MRIKLFYLPDAKGDLFVGTLDGKPLAYRGRKPFVEGREVVADGDYLEALAEAVEGAAENLWGKMWVTPLSELALLSDRACRLDRIMRPGLPAWLLKALAWTTFEENPLAFGLLLLAARAMEPSGKNPDDRPEILRLLPPGTGQPADLGTMADKAAYLVSWIDEHMAADVRKTQG